MISGTGCEVVNDFRVSYLQSGLGCMALKRLLLLSGGMDSIALGLGITPGPVSYD